MQDGEVKNKLSPAQVSVMRHRVTEPPYFGKYWDFYAAGSYRCAACDTPLFSSDEKFDSRSGWPTFRKPLSERDLQFKSEPGPEDKVEVRCKKCKSHLGYVIPNDPPYYRINSVCLNFEAREPAPAAAARPVAEDKKEEAPKAAKKKKDLAVLDEDTVVVSPVQEERSSGASLVSGIVIGLIIGSVLTWLVLPGGSPQPSALLPEATTTAATTTATSAPAVETKTKAKPTVETPQNNASNTDSGAQSGAESATSTQ